MRGTWISHVPVYTGFHHFCGDYLPSMSYRALAIHWYLSCEAQQCTACVSWQRYQWIMQESTLRTASEVQCLLTLQLVNWTCGCAWLSLFKWICPKWNRGGNIYLFFTFSPSLCCVISQCVFLSLKQNKHKHTKNYPRPPLSPAPFFALLSLFAQPFPPPLLSNCSYGLQLLGNSWLNKRGMQLTNYKSSKWKVVSRVPAVTTKALSTACSKWSLDVVPYVYVQYMHA